MFELGGIIKQNIESLRGMVEKAPEMRMVRFIFIDKFFFFATHFILTRRFIKSHF